MSRDYLMIKVPSETVSIEIQGELNQEEQDDIAALQNRSGHPYFQRFGNR